MKKYIEPSIIIKDIITESHMATGSLGVDDTPNDGLKGDGNSRRGQWGNLWYDDSEEE